MKKIVNVTEIAGEGLESLLGESVLLFCLNYIYNGVLSGVNGDCVLLENPSIIYETGAFNNTTFKDKQSLPFQLYVQKSAIESFGKTDKK